MLLGKTDGPVMMAICCVRVLSTAVYVGKTAVLLVSVLCPLVLVVVVGD